MAPQPKSLSATSICLLLFTGLLLSEISTSFAFQIPTPRIKVDGGGRCHRAFASTASSVHSSAPTRHLSRTRRSTTTATKSFGQQSRTILDMGASSSSISAQLPDATKDAFQNKSILLTGASRGLGKSLAHALSYCNPSLLILSGRDEAALQEVQRECLQIAKEQQQQSASTSTSAMKVEIVVCDLSDKSSVDKMASESQQLTPPGTTIDVLINNGGISSRSSFLETKLDVDERLMQVNFFSGAALAKKIVPGMVEKGEGGKVIWISSVQGKLGTPYRTSYAASKFAVQGYCEALRSELASSNVSVHVVSPGYIRTNLSMSAVMGDGKAYSKMDSTTENGEDPDEVAAQILNSVTDGKTDFVVAATFSATAAIWLKFLAPSFLESMLVKRFEKQKIK